MNQPRIVPPRPLVQSTTPSQSAESAISARARTSVHIVPTRHQAVQGSELPRTLPARKALSPSTPSPPAERQLASSPTSPGVPEIHQRFQRDLHALLNHFAPSASSASLSSASLSSASSATISQSRTVPTALPLKPPGSGGHKVRSAARQQEQHQFAIETYKAITTAAPEMGVGAIKMALADYGPFSPQETGKIFRAFLKLLSAAQHPSDRQIEGVCTFARGHGGDLMPAVVWHELQTVQQGLAEPFKTHVQNGLQLAFSSAKKIRVVYPDPRNPGPRSFTIEDNARQTWADVARENKVLSPPACTRALPGASGSTKGMDGGARAPLDRKMQAPGDAAKRTRAAPSSQRSAGAVVNASLLEKMGLPKRLSDLQKFDLVWLLERWKSAGVLFAADDTTLELGSGIALQRQPLLDLLRQRARTVQLEDHVRFLCAAGKGVRELTHAQSVTRDFLWVDSRAENLGLSNNLSQALIEQVQAGKAVPDLFNIAIAQITEVLDQSGLVTTLIDDLLALL